MNEQLSWHKCTQVGDVPPARDSHSSCIVNDKMYIYGGQGTGEVFFDDLYCVRVFEQDAGSKFIAIWEKVVVKSEVKPYPRTSHTCVAYKNRYLIVIGGETESSNIQHKVKENEAPAKSESSSGEEEEQRPKPFPSEPVHEEGKLSRGKFDRRMSHHE